MESFTFNYKNKANVLNTFAKNLVAIKDILKIQKYFTWTRTIIQICIIFYSQIKEKV